jgi:hypothetical protein
MKKSKYNVLTLLAIAFTVGIITISLQSKAQSQTSVHNTMAGYAVR